MGKAIGLIGLVLALGATLSFMLWRSAAGAADELQVATTAAASTPGETGAAAELVATEAGASQSEPASTPPANEAQASIPAARREQLTLQFASLSSDQLKAELRVTDGRFSELMESISDRHFAEGNFEVLEGAMASRLPQRHTGPLVAYRFNKNQGTAKKTTMLAKDYPGLYELRELIRLLDAEIKRRAE